MACRRQRRFGLPVGAAGDGGGDDVVDVMAADVGAGDDDGLGEQWQWDDPNASVGMPMESKCDFRQRAKSISCLLMCRELRDVGDVLNRKDKMKHAKQECSQVEERRDESVTQLQETLVLKNFQTEWRCQMEWAVLME